MKDLDRAVAGASEEIPALGMRDVLQEVRFVSELASLALRWRQMTKTVEPASTETPVILLPGFGASDLMMEPMRQYLMRHGHRVYRWGLGRNHGRLGTLMPAVSERINQVVQKRGEPVQVVGWSLGGYLAREIARDHPEWFRQIITLGSPVFGGAKYTIFNSLYRQQGIDLESLAARIEERFKIPLAVPVTSIYTRTDGIVCWRACLDHRSPNVRHLEVKGSHTGLVYNPETIRLVEQCLRGGPESAGVDL